MLTKWQHIPFDMKEQEFMTTLALQLAATRRHTHAHWQHIPFDMKDSHVGTLPSHLFFVQLKTLVPVRLVMPFGVKPFPPSTRLPFRTNKS